MSAALLDRCEVCRALVDLDDLFCSNCGREVSDHRAVRPKQLKLKARNFECEGCGASMNYDAKAKALKCPFCGSNDLKDDGSKGILEPECVLPFVIDQAGAETKLKHWLGSSFWHPNDLRNSAQLTELKPVFVPYWIFETRVKTYWTADTSRVPWNARASWAPVTGAWEKTYPDVWIPASEGVSASELIGVEPYDASQAVPPGEVDLENLVVEQFSVARKYARPLAQSRIEEREVMAVAKHLEGACRNVRVNVLMEDATSQAALAPLYVMAYSYRNKVYRFVLNAQTGRSVGVAPFSYPKLAAMWAIIFAIIGLIIYIVVSGK